MTPILYHSGGDSWFSAWENLWWHVAHYEARKQARDALLLRPGPWITDEGEWANHNPLGMRQIPRERPVATGGNRPKRAECAWYCKCVKHYNNIVPPEE